MENLISLKYHRCVASRLYSERDKVISRPVFGWFRPNIHIISFYDFLVILEPKDDNLRNIAEFDIWFWGQKIIRKLFAFIQGRDYQPIKVGLYQYPEFLHLARNKRNYYARHSL